MSDSDVEKPKKICCQYCPPKKYCCRRSTGKSMVGDDLAKIVQDLVENIIGGYLKAEDYAQGDDPSDPEYVPWDISIQDLPPSYHPLRKPKKYSFKFLYGVIWGSAVDCSKGPENRRFFIDIKIQVNEGKCGREPRSCDDCGPDVCDVYTECYCWSKNQCQCQSKLILKVKYLGQYRVIDLDKKVLIADNFDKFTKSMIVGEVVRWMDNDYKTEYIDYQLPSS